MKKKCRKCGGDKELKDFPKVATCNDGRYHTCRECFNKIESVKRKLRREEVNNFYKMFL